MSDDICGSMDTTTGEPCQNPAGSCPWHDTDNPPETGRDTKLTKSRQEAIAGMIEDGHSVTAAARSNGVTEQTVMNWIDRGQEQEEGIYAEFFERYTQARGVGEQNYLELVKEMAKEESDHRFIASLMKQLYQDAWADTETGVEADTVKLEVSERVRETWSEDTH